jgi:hypothetical protein
MNKFSINNKIKNTYLHPLYVKDPIMYTIKGNKRKRLHNPFNYPLISPKGDNERIPEKIQDILVGTLLGDCGGEMQKKEYKSLFFSFKQSVKHIDYLFYIFFYFFILGLYSITFYTFNKIH